jgi:hypothetical protein
MTSLTTSILREGGLRLAHDLAAFRRKRSGRCDGHFAAWEQPELLTDGPRAGFWSART